MITYKPGGVPQSFRPLVYGWRRNDQYLYIGKSKRGTRRIIEGVMKFYIGPEDVVDIWFTTMRRIDSLEIKLIKKYNPIHNIAHGHCSFDPLGNQICACCARLISPPRSNQKFCSDNCRIKHWKIHETRKLESIIKYRKPTKKDIDGLKIKPVEFLRTSKRI